MSCLMCQKRLYQAILVILPVWVLRSNRQMKRAHLAGASSMNAPAGLSSPHPRQSHMLTPSELLLYEDLGSLGLPEPLPMPPLTGLFAFHSYPIELEQGRLRLRFDAYAHDRSWMGRESGSW